MRSGVKEALRWAGSIIPRIAEAISRRHERKRNEARRKHMESILQGHVPLRSSEMRRKAHEELDR